MTDRVGFVGLGNMGFPVAERLLAAGYPVLAFDVRADAVAALVALGPTPPLGHCGRRRRGDRAGQPAHPQAARAVATDISAGARVRRWSTCRRSAPPPRRPFTPNWQVAESVTSTARSAAGPPGPGPARSR
jgi:nucleoside-diphosphate-sugar epimerase